MDIRPDQIRTEIIRHYAEEPLKERILAALRTSGKPLDSLQIDDMAPIDEFHSRGRKATIELALAANIGQEMHVLDLGSGIGGPSRFLAATYGCKVTGIDLSYEYCQVAAMLSEFAGLSHLVEYRQGDALDLPFQDQSFDAVWTQHASMNIADKKKLFSEAYRVLKTDGVLALYDVISGSGEPLHYPVPWATVPEASFLLSAGELRSRLTEAGFSINLWQDETDRAVDWFSKIAHRPVVADRSSLGIHLLLGDKFPDMLRNQFRNMQENRARIIKVIARRY